MLGAGKHEHLVPVALLDEVRQQVPLVLLGHTIRNLLDAIGRCIAGRNLDLGGITQNPAREPANVIRISGREHQVLAARGQQLDHPADGRDEAHVQHAISFIQHEHTHLTQVERVLIGKIEQPTGRGDQYIAPASQGIDLRIDAHSAEYNLGAQIDVRSIRARTLGNLCR